MTTLTLTPELEQQLLDQIRRLPGEDLAAIARLLASLALAPPHDEQDEDDDDRELVAAMRRLSQPAFERAWEEG